MLEPTDQRRDQKKRKNAQKENTLHEVLVIVLRSAEKGCHGEPGANSQEKGESQSGALGRCVSSLYRLLRTLGL